MKRNFKFLIIFMVAMVVLAGCKNGNSSAKVENKDANANSAVENSKETSKVKENLKPVDGAVIGSMSSYVEDREVWKDFVDEKYIDSAKRDFASTCLGFFWILRTPKWQTMRLMAW